MADLDQAVNSLAVDKDQVKIDQEVQKIVYVVLRNETHRNKKTKKDDEYTTIIRVFETEEKAHDYVINKTKQLNNRPNVQFYCVPTPYGDI